MIKDFDSAASYFLELASEQRLKILDELSKKPSRIAVMAKKFDATSQEIHRNLERLVRAKLAKKGMNDHYHITTAGNVMISQLPLVKFLTKNADYFESHNLGDIPLKFTKRLGVLDSCRHIKGVTSVLEKWRSIYSGANEYVYDVLSESPPGITEPLLRKISKGVKYRHIISKGLVEPKNREKILEKFGYYDYIKQGKIKRKTTKSVVIVLILNEKEAGVIFSIDNDEPDLRHMFYGIDSKFHEWCVDFFEYLWKKSSNLARETPKK